MPAAQRSDRDRHDASVDVTLKLSRTLALAACRLPSRSATPACANLKGTLATEASDFSLPQYAGGGLGGWGGGSSQGTFAATADSAGLYSNLEAAAQYLAASAYLPNAFSNFRSPTRNLKRFSTHRPHQIVGVSGKMPPT
jgi:hypothetical protein